MSTGTGLEPAEWCDSYSGRLNMEHCDLESQNGCFIGVCFSVLFAA